MSLPFNYPPEGPLGATDPPKWRLSSSDHGRHVWHYVSSTASPVWGFDEMGVKREDQQQSEESKYWLGLELGEKEGQEKLRDPEGNPFESAKNGSFTPLY